MSRRFSDSLREEMGPSVPVEDLGEDGKNDRPLAAIAGGLGVASVQGDMRGRGQSPFETEQLLSAATRGAEILIEALRETGHITGELNYTEISDTMEKLTRGEA